MDNVAFTPAARRAFRKLPADVQGRIRAALARFAQTGEGDVKKMVNVDGARIRLGDYRAIFTQADNVIEVRAVGHRRDIYR